MTTLKLWQERAMRQKTRLVYASRDLQRWASWYLMGNKYFFSRYAKDIGAAHEWCFIVGCNNSGTSLLRRMLQRTGQVSTFPLEGQRCTTTLARANKRDHERVWTEYLGELRMTDQDSTEIFPRLLHDWMREIPLPFHEIIVEKTTANSVRMTWLQKAFPRAKFIGMVRNGYAVTEGTIRKGGKSAERGARHWNVVNRVMNDDAKKVKDYLLLRYEDLVENPGETASRIGSFLGIDPEKLRKVMRENYGFTTVRGAGEQSVRNLNAEGIARLSSDEIEIIHEEAHEMLDYFGYKAKIEPTIR